MTEAGSGDHTPTKAGDKLPRAHKRCVNKNCREILTLATKVSATGDGLPQGRAPQLPFSPARPLLDCATLTSPAVFPPAARLCSTPAVLQEMQRCAI